MSFIIPLADIHEDDQGRTGGKAFALAVMSQRRMNVPDALSITTEAYDEYITLTGLREKIMMELNRKSFDDMRWEEFWDISLRIRNAFLNTPVPDGLREMIRGPVETAFGGRAVVVRSSAPGEDTSQTSFAGLHSSYVNIRGTESIIEHIKLVWASLWSDASLLYRRELGLDESKSSMAVVIQEIIAGEVSGIGFGKNPNDSSQSVIESVYGLNEGLVDGTLEPDRWLIDRADGAIISHTPALRNSAVYPSPGGTGLQSLPPELQSKPPLSEKAVREIYELLMAAEEIFHAPQDVEWTIKDNRVFVLQSRPITTSSEEGGDDKRGWYLSLTRSFENLRGLRSKIETELVPELQNETEKLAAQDLSRLSDGDLAAEAARRKDLFVKWKNMYWDYFIPFAHGMRFFGVVYNDAVHPADPYEFLSLLSTGSLESLERNNMLAAMAILVKHSETLQLQLKEGHCSDTEFNRLLTQFIESCGDLICMTPRCEQESRHIMNLILEMAAGPVRSKPENEKSAELENNYFSHFSGRKKEYAAEILELGRASYRMRDNDNIYMGRLKAEVLRAENELGLRSGGKHSPAAERQNAPDYFDSLSLPDNTQKAARPAVQDAAGFTLKARQITGQPAGPGLATGKAHVIRGASDLMHFRKGEVLVCDAVDPNMTFVVPLACAVVERRGGMLIHGAIIAREYGLPCVTGIAGATELIHTGDRVTVDGYLGIVIVG